MRIREHEGFQIQIHAAGSGYFAEVYRKEKLLRTIRREDLEPVEGSFRSSTEAIEAAREWINKTYSRKIKYKGFIQAGFIVKAQSN